MSKQRIHISASVPEMYRKGKGYRGIDMNTKVINNTEYIKAFYTYISVMQQTDNDTHWRD